MRTFIHTILFKIKSLKIEIGKLAVQVKQLGD